MTTGILGSTVLGSCYQYERSFPLSKGPRTAPSARALYVEPAEGMIARRCPGYPERLRHEVKREARLECFKERSRAWLKSGRGWRAPGDESLIKWPGPHQRSASSFQLEACIGIAEYVKPLQCLRAHSARFIDIPISMYVEIKLSSTRVSAEKQKGLDLRS